MLTSGGVRFRLGNQGLSYACHETVPRLGCVTKSDLRSLSPSRDLNAIPRTAKSERLSADQLQQASSAAVSTLLKVMVDASTEWSKKLSETHNARADVKGIAGWLISVGSTMGRRYNFEPEQKVQSHTEDP